MIVDAFASDGSAANRAYLSDIGHFRASNTWTVALMFRPNPGAVDGVLMSMRASVNDNLSHMLAFDSVAGRVSYSYNAEQQAVTPDSSVAGGTWYGLAITSDGSLTITLHLFTSAGALIATTTGLAGSVYFDSQTQEITLLAHYAGGAASYNYPGRMTLPLFLRGTALSATQLGAYFADPLSQGDSLVASLGSQVTWFDNTRLDRGPGAETLSFEGTAAWGSSNGPTVPDRAAGNNMTATTGSVRINPGTANLTDTPSPDATSVGPKALAIIYSTEQRVSVTGTNFGTSPPLVQLTLDVNGLTGLETQTVRAYSDTSLTFDCLLSALSPGLLWLFITNQTVGHPAYLGRDSIQVDVRANPGPSAVAVRRTVPALNAPINVAIATFESAPEFFATHAQEVLTYSVSAGSLPPGVSLNTATGQLTGTISASAGPSYSATLRATDPNGSYAEQTVTFSLGGGASAVGTRFFLRGVRR